MKKYFVLLLWALMFLPAFSQREFCIVELNAENFFDPLDDPLTDDNDFTTQSYKKWTWRRFSEKVRNIGKEIAAAGGIIPPDIVALCEVENDTVMSRLTHSGPLRRARYGYFITHSPDRRGINCALLYNGDTFKPVSHFSLRPDFSGLPEKFTRDVLYVSGRVATGDTLDIMVCHMPSRLDPLKKGEPYRARIAAMLRHTADSLAAVRRHFNLVITGDFNDTPSSKVLASVLEAAAIDTVAPQESRLYNLMRGRKMTGDVRGTYCYDGKWETIDNFIVSGHMLSSRASLRISSEDCTVFAPKFLLYTHDGITMPLRSYRGAQYLGGFSDHLPLRAVFRYSW